MPSPKDPTKRAEWIAKKIKTATGKKRTPEQKVRMAQAQKDAYINGTKVYKGYIQTEEIKKKRSNSIKETIKKQKEHGIVRVMSDKFKINVSKRFKGKQQTPEHIEKRIKLLRGRGRTQEEKDKISNTLKEKYKNGYINPSPWTGKHRDDATKLKLSEAQKNKIRTKETKQKTSKTLKEGYESGRLKPYIRTKEHIEQNSLRMQQRMQSKDFLKIGTKLEQDTIKIFNNKNIPFIRNKCLKLINGKRRFYDFYLPTHNLLIETDGTYWHSKGISNENLNKTQRNNHENDVIKNNLALQRKFRLLRIWEDELDKLENLIKNNFIGLEYMEIQNIAI